MANTGFHISLYATFLLIFVTLLQTNCEEKCFCQLSGQIDDCFCDIETLEKFNNEQVFPLVSQLVKRDFFRYYKVNMFKPCNYFDGDIGFCESESCGVKPCSEEDLPVGLRNGNFNKHTPDTEDVECNKPKKSISDINGTLSNVTIDFLDRWDKHDDTVHQFCDIDDESSIELQYIDLIANPERYTGYKGPMAWRIWRAIYEENCFIPETMSQNVNPFKRIPQATAEENDGKRLKFSHSDLQGMCLEKRVFYRVISGLHTSINTHLSAKYLFEDGWGERRWEANLAEFQRRFDKDVTKGEGTARLKNLYFIYLLELRALSKAAEYFNRGNVVLFTGRDKEDVKTKEMLTQLLDLTKKFPMHFDEGVMFQDKNSRGLKREFVQRFLNVTRIIDCVTCEKCRLWGKLQTQGLGTALKVLFSAKEMNGKSDSPFQLIRQEVVSLINAFARLSESIKSLEMFRAMIKDTRNNGKEEL
uniref:ERO1-like protein beta n=1 Tax=Ciona intestinalis TaxID=7719 RepID=UPI000180CF02|nr:ERO1-like protein beta [Ciona intestinalis]|eukprot:XP_002126047.1 ERO1-like protein beta [Ciona intestinalis]